MACQDRPKQRATRERQVLTDDDIEWMRNELLDALEDKRRCEQNTKHPDESSPTPVSAA